MISPPSTRRDFLHRLSRAAVGAAALSLLEPFQRARAIEPIRRKGAARFRTSLVAYSFRKYLQSAEAATRLTLFDVVDFAADQGFDGVELTGYYFETPATAAYLERLRRYVYLRGLAVSGTAVGDELAQPDPSKLPAQIDLVKTGIDRAVLLGAPYVRMFAGHARNLVVPGVLGRCIDAIEECAEYAGSKGIFIGMENDGGILPDTVLEIVHAVKSPWFALNLDLGNFHTRDVYADVARCAPYAVNIHYKRLIQEEGKPETHPDVPRFLETLRQVRYQGYLAFEYESEQDPFQAIPPWKSELGHLLAT